MHSRHTTRLLFRLQILLLSGIVALPARGIAEEDTTSAKAHFEVGNGLFTLGRYPAAIAEFAAGYRLSRRVGFLYNMGLAYVKLNDLESARAVYERHLREATPDDPQRPDVEARLKQINERLRAGRPTPAADSPPLPTLDESVTAINSEKVAVTNDAIETPAPAKKSFIRRYWSIIPVSAVVLGTAIGLGAYYGTRGGCSDPLGCFHLQ